MPRFNINSQQFGENLPPYTIAEVGINHNGSVDTAKKMIDVAKECGVDAVKFQTFKAEEFCSDPSQTYTYKSQGRSVTESMLEMFKRYEFSFEQWSQIQEHARASGIEFFSTPQNPSDLQLLLKLGVNVLKVGSDDFNNIPLLREYASTGLPLILSCGMADLADVYRSLEAVGALDGYPIALMYCTSQYPTPSSDVHLRKLKVLTTAFPDLLVGFSDHTQGATAAIGSVVLGARIFEKHFTLSHNYPGPDHWFSAMPEELKQWNQGIKDSWLMLGSQTFRPPENERKMRAIARRSLTVIEPTSAGQPFTEKNLGLRRPGTGLAPSFFEQVLGRVSKRDLVTGHQITLDDLQ